jgi:L-Ala-D/L-Glu epimerase
MKLSVHPLTMRARRPFRISREEQIDVTNVLLTLSEGELTGYGEASPSLFYGETAETVLELLQNLNEFIENFCLNSVQDIEKIWEAVWPRLAPSRAAQCAVDVALWDLLAKQKGLSVAALALGTAPQPRVSSFTIGISTRDELREKVEEVRSLPVIKIKLGSNADIEAVRYIAARTEATLRVDANCAWSDAPVDRLSRELKELRVEFIEQPLPPQEDERMTAVLEASELPILADESCISPEDIERMPGRFSGFNIKLVKCGGLTPALRMLRRGQELGLKMMVGCMLESSVLISAGLVIAQQTDYADLDGNWLIAKDPFTGMESDNGRISVKDLPGLGVCPGNALQL